MSYQTVHRIVKDTVEPLGSTAITQLLQADRIKKDVPLEADGPNLATLWLKHLDVLTNSEERTIRFRSQALTCCEHL